MVHTVVDGTYRQTNLTNESPNIWPGARSFALPKSSSCVSANASLSCAAIFLKVLLFRTINLKKVHATSTLGMRLCAPFVSANCSPSPIARSSSITSCSGKSRRRLAPCAPRGSTVRMVSPIISRRISTSLWSRPPISSTLRAYARERGWDKLRLLSAGNNTFKYDLGSEDREGGQDSTISVFTRDAKGYVRHFYTAHPRMAPDIQERGIDLLTPMWHFMDLTPQGRGSWYASLAYGTKVHAST